jgi:5,10-methenyltetrahydrofolate synthetase
MVKRLDPEKLAASELTSSPCMLHELCEDGTMRVDPVQARDVARWRKAERERLIKARCLLSAGYRSDQTAMIAQGLHQVIATSRISAPAVSIYWPIAGEPDLRPWMKTLYQSGACVALPVAVALAQPLTFREWRPDARLERGLWNIPYPSDGRLIVPNVVIAPVVGFDPQCYRLGFGGGFYDRTLATLKPSPLTIGVGYPEAAIRTIFPQSHDIPMHWIVSGTETVQAPNTGIPSG